MSLFDRLFGRRKAHSTSEVKKEDKIKFSLRVAKNDAKTWWNKQPTRRNEARCDRCSRPIPRGRGCLTPPMWGNISIGSPGDLDMMTLPLGSSPDLVCESCFRRYAAIGEDWAVPWSQKNVSSQHISSSTEIKQRLKQRLVEQKGKGPQDPLARLRKVEEELKKQKDQT